MVRPRAPYIAVSCDRQYRPPAGNRAGLGFPYGTRAPGQPRGLPGLELTGFGELDFDPQLDLG
jgi:hypothetical protein